MPSITIKDPSHCLYIDPQKDEAHRFKQQCERIIHWQSSGKGLTPRQLFGLDEDSDWKQLKRNKMLLVLSFHPEKNENNAMAREALTVLQAAFEYLCFKEALVPDAQRLRESSVQNNPFYQHIHQSIGGSISIKYIQPENTDAQQRIYIQRIESVYKAQKMSADDEQFFRQSITENPAFLLSYTEIGLTLMEAVAEYDGTSEFFQWLTNTQLAEEALLRSKRGYDCFSSVLINNRCDCLEILVNLFGIEAFHKSTRDRDLIMAMLPCVESDKKFIDSVYYLLDDLAYKPSHGVSYIVSDHIKYNDDDVDLFKRACHLFLERGFELDYPMLFITAVNAGRIRILHLMHENGLVTPTTVPLIFEFASQRKEFFQSCKNAEEVATFLQDQGYEKVPNPVDDPQDHKAQEKPDEREKEPVQYTQLSKAKKYLEEREKGDDYKTKLSFFGCYTLNFGFSKAEKTTAARALIAYLEKGTLIPASCKPALSQSELGKIATLNPIKYEPKPEHTNRCCNW